MTTKKVLTVVHRWVGLVLAVLVLMQASTGLLLVNKEALEPLLHPEVRVTAGPAASLDAVMASLQAARPALKLDRIYTPQEPGRALTARMLDKQRALTIAYVDPSTAKVISIGPIKDYPLQFSERLHVSLMQGAIGQVILLVEGICLLFMAISGLIIWWPKLKMLKLALTIHTKAGSRRLLRDLHLVPGALAAVFIAVTAFTGAGVIAEPFLKMVVGLFAPVGPGLRLPDMPPLKPGQDLLPAQVGLDQLRTRFPDGRLRQIRFLGPQERIVGVVMESDKTLNPRAHHLAAVDRGTGRMTVWEDGDDMLRGDAILAWLLPIHTGEAWGWLRGAVTLLTALSLMLLTVTGVWMWVAKPRRRRG